MENIGNIKISRRTVFIGIGITTAATAGFILIERKTFGKNLSAYISAKLEERSNQYGDIRDYQDVFNGQTYIQNVDSKIKKEYPSLAYIKLKDNYVTQYRKDLYDAMNGLGTDEEKVKNTIKQLRDKVAISQVADSYQKNYNRNLLDALIDELGIDSSDMKDIFDDISIKLPFRLTKK